MDVRKAFLWWRLQRPLCRSQRHNLLQPVREGETALNSFISITNQSTRIGDLMVGGKFVRCLTVDALGRTYECWVSPDGGAGTWEILSEDAEVYSGDAESPVRIYDIRKASPSELASDLVSAIRRKQPWRERHRSQGYGEGE